MSNTELSRRTRWKDWANGAWWVLTPGVDHEQPCRAALQTARMWALKNGLRAEAQLPKPSAPFETEWKIRFVPREGVPRGSSRT